MNLKSTRSHGPCDRVAIARRLTAAAGASAACIGFYDLSVQRFARLWIGHGDGDATPVSESEITTILRGALYGAVPETPCCGGPDAPPECWIASSRFLIGLGERQDQMITVAAFVSAEDSPMPDDEGQRQLLQIGLTYAMQTLRETAPSRNLPRDLATESILESLSMNFLVADADGGVDSMNDAAGRWLATECRIDVLGGRLAPRNPRVQNMLAEALETATGETPRTAILHVDGTDGQPRSIIVLPVERSADHALLVFGQDKTDSTMHELFLEAFGLTLAERRLALHLLDGKCLQDAANDMNLTISTARSYLKRVFTKIGINRQSQLIALYHTLLPPVRASGGESPDETARPAGTASEERARR